MKVSWFWALLFRAAKVSFSATLFITVNGSWPYVFVFVLPSHNPILANFLRSNVRTWKIWIVQASPWCVDPCSSGVDLQELKKFFCRWTKGGTSVNSFFQCGPPFDSRVEIFLSSWRSRPPEHGSTHHGEAWTIQIFHVLTFDLIKLAKIGLWGGLVGLDLRTF